MRIIKTFSLKKAAAQFALFLVALAACQQDNEILNSVDTQNVNSESASSALMNENADIAAKAISAMTNSQYAGTQDTIVLFLSSKDSRLAGATVTRYRTGTADSPAGQIIIDFKTGRTDNNGVIRKGQININYAGKRWTPGSYYVIRLNKFIRNSAYIEGIDSTNFTSTGKNNDTLQLSFHSILESRITFGDGMQIENNGTLDKIWNRYIDINYGKIDPLKGELDVTGSGTGTNKLRKSYTWNIDSALVYRLPCWFSNKVYIPVKGKKTLTVANTIYTINYNDATNGGNCDNQATVKLNGKEKTIIVTGDGN